MKKRYLIAFLSCLALAVIIGIQFIQKDDLQRLSKPDKIELDITITNHHYEFLPGDKNYEELYNLIKKDWDNTRKLDNGELVCLQLDYLDEERDNTGTAIHLYYEKAKNPGRNSIIEHGHYYSFFPYTLEFAAITENKDYYKAAILPHFIPSGELQGYITSLKWD
ncbi:hypothetical protein [Fusibacillus kribbianus]|uniref:Uncharacterized protein n=1 Tax=Fusibacillus kribbianus TaxID=3044208 RepID=A0AAP4B9U6_9FIRM|nr:hypothetical protein [Ruminococcus sp. YH-rum2234]MDI9241892.1 hypothetical protein [Ruminococcus sp. YH-rum2234]